MNEKGKLKLFISYSHEDEEPIARFLKHISPMRSNGLIADWYDRKLIAGSEFQDQIDNQLQDADIICLFISANFLSSKACEKEKKEAIELKNSKGTRVVPIILSPCGWLDDIDLSKLLALPIDGREISFFSDSNEGWKIVCEELKKVINEEMEIRQLEISDNFLAFLEDTELLSRAHSQKVKVLIDDIFIYPELVRFDALKEYDRKISSEALIRKLYEYKK